MLFQKVQIKLFLGKIKTLFELTQYKFIMQQDNNAKKALETIFEGQLNENEINNIPTFGQGDTTLIINGMNNITFHVEISEEKKYYLKEEYNVDKKKLIIGGSILVILIIGGTIFSLNKLKNNKQEPIKVEENKKDNKIVEKK